MTWYKVAIEFGGNMKRNLFLLWVFWCVGWFNICFAVTTDTQVDISDRIKLTQSGLVLNRATRTYDTTVSLTNITNVAMPGPIMVSVNAISPSTVTLANATGTSATGSTVIAIPAQQALKPGQSVNNIVLKFNNPSNAKFTFKTNVLGVLPSQQGVNNISSVFPASGYSSTVVTISGNNFLPYSVVKFGDKTIQIFEYLSPQQIQFVVPLDVNHNGHLVSLSTGDYQVTVDGGVGTNFTVDALPTNPNPAGMVLNSTIQQLNQFVSENQSSYLDAVNYLKTQITDQNLLKLLNIVIGMESDLMRLLNTDIPNSISNIDPESLDTIERLLVANQTINAQLFSNANQVKKYFNKTPDTSIFLSGILGIKNAMADSSFDGNSWLENRSALVSSSDHNFAVDLLIKSSNYLLLPAIGVTEATPFIVYLEQALDILNVIVVIQSAAEGAIDKFDISALSQDKNGININNIDNPDPLSLNPIKQITLDISNEDVVLNATKIFINPSITIAYKIDIPSILSAIKNELIHSGKLKTEITLQIANKFSDLLGVIKNHFGLDTAKAEPEVLQPITVDINLDKVEWDDNTNVLPGTSLLRSLLPDSWFSTCKSLIPMKYVDISNQDGSVFVYLSNPKLTDSNNIAHCAARIDKKYRTKTERIKYVETNFRVHNYESIDVVVSGDGSGKVTSNPQVTYNSVPSINCTKSNLSACTAIFDVNQYSQVTLTAKPDSGSVISGWSGDCDSTYIASDGSSGTCTVAMNGNPKNVTAKFGNSYPDITGKWFWISFMGCPTPVTEECVKTYGNVRYSDQSYTEFFADHTFDDECYAVDGSIMCSSTQGKSDFVQNSSWSQNGATIKKTYPNGFSYFLYLRWNGQRFIMCDQYGNTCYARPITN